MKELKEKTIEALKDAIEKKDGYLISVLTSLLGLLFSVQNQEDGENEIEK